MSWHLTHAGNVANILKNGLLPQIGPRSANCESEAKVHLFTTFDDVFDGGAWLENAFDDDVKLSLLFVAEPKTMSGAWQEHSAPIPADKIILVIPDVDGDMPTSHVALYHAMDAVTDPLGVLEDFRKASVEMSELDYGLLIGDESFADPERMMRVYPGGLYIEPVEDGGHMLTIENAAWVTGDDQTLADLEERLFNWLREDHLLDHTTGQPEL